VVAQAQAQRPAAQQRRQQAIDSRITIGKLANLSRQELLALHERNRALYNEWVRRMVVQHNRIDILAREVLGYEVRRHHLKILKHQHKNKQGQILVWRGAGKSTMGTTTQCIFQLIKDRDRRILLASKTQGNAIGFLKEIKGHFETNEKLKEIFGNFVGTSQWADDAIEVSGRTKPHKEPSINTVGVGGAVASKHYDIIIADDLVDEENSRTKHQRDKMTDWYYKVLLPTLNPPSSTDRFVGCLWVIGTRYHYEDQYGRLLKRQPDGTGGEMATRTLIIPIIREDGSPEWAERFPDSVIATYKAGGIIRFNSQYMCNCDAMQGQIFQYDDCQVLNEAQMAAVDWESLRKFHGVDLAISESEEADMFAQVVVGFGPDPTGAKGGPDHVFVLDYQEESLRFAEQTRDIIAFRKKHNPIRTGVEANAYQAAQVQNLEDKGQRTIIPLYTLKDKTTRANNLEAEYFHPKRIWFRPEHEHLREILVLFPNYRYKDLFDALDFACGVAKKRRKKQRAKEPGLI
jgi:hypothetical protein